ncbi:hypothetical protein ACQUGX_13570, partial [Enterococcus faecium]|uniref:hypothetical protein n=1 Tax=Enterococcus faecium TaxID=1352 RepID=UPI003D21129B
TKKNFTHVNSSFHYNLPLQLKQKKALKTSVLRLPSANIIFEDYGITVTYREHKFKLNVYDIKTALFDLYNIKFVTKMLYMIP